jgi:hypothetical protein
VSTIHTRDNDLAAIGRGKWSNNCSLAYKVMSSNDSISQGVVFKDTNGVCRRPNTMSTTLSFNSLTTTNRKRKLLRVIDMEHKARAAKMTYEIVMLLDP